MRPAQLRDFRVIQSHRNPYFSLFRWEVEIGRHHADDFAVETVEHDFPAHDFRIGSEAALPQSVAEYCNPVPALPGLLFTQRTSDHRVHAQNGEYISGDV